MTDTSNNYFASLQNEEFIVLTTFRTSGAPVPTTVWFAETDGKIYITTMAHLKKVDRIRENPKVQLIPSDRVGNTHGTVLEAQARIMDVNEYLRAQSALQEKYGQQYLMVTNQIDVQHPSGSRIFIEVIPPAQHVSM